MYQKQLDVRILLKQHTDQIHNKLHHVPILKKISHGKFTLDDYYNYLTINRSFYRNLESHFADVNFTKFDDEINFIPWIEQDLGTIQKSADQSEYCFSNLSNNFSAYIGYAYVKYGSMTGSMVLLSKITRTNQVDVESLNFLSHSVSNRDRIWPRFLEFMQNCRDSIDIDVSIQSATFCFNLMYQYASEVEFRGPNPCHD